MKSVLTVLVLGSAFAVGACALTGLQLQQRHTKQNERRQNGHGRQDDERQDDGREDEHRARWIPTK